MPIPDARRPAARGDVLTLGFATTTAMWGVGYLCHLPDLSLPSWMVFVLVVACLLAGGAVAGRLTGRLRTAVEAGVLTGLLNLMILGSVLRGEDWRTLAASAAIWVPGSVALSAVCFLIGALAVRGFGRVDSPAAVEANWPARFAGVLVLATLLLISVGGVVTGYDAGLAVPDWPNTFGSMMFLYPLSKMTGGIYYEHAHRLMGSLVGLTTLVFAFYLLRVEPRGWLRALAMVALVIVIVQGVLGGLRVTGTLTLGMEEEKLAPNLALAMVHGVLAQVFFTMIVAIRLFLSDAWKTLGDRPVAGLIATGKGPSTGFAAPSAPARTATAPLCTLGLAAVLVTFVQIAVGATVRHTAGGLHLHITLAFIVLAVSGWFALRSRWQFDHEPLIRHLGGVMITILSVQLVLGFGALAAVMLAPGGSDAPVWRILLTTAHQTLGAIVLAGTTALYVCHARLADRPAPAPAPASGRSVTV